MTRFLFTSDTHYNHAKVITYCERPFSSVEEMNETLIANWNRVVGPDDTVFHLGDFAMGPNLAQNVTAIRERLNGKIILILGNHDRSANFYKTCGFNEVCRVWEGDINGRHVRMRHHPPSRETFYAKANNLAGSIEPFDLVLSGHVHEEWRRKGKIINVGVDQWGFTPRTLDELVTAQDELSDYGYEP